MTAIHLFSV